MKDSLASASGWYEDTRWRIARHVTLALVGVFFLSTLREGHSWGDDFAQYLRHADNIANRASYSETGYIYNPQNAIVGPEAYPPGLPAALAPVAAIFGANLSAYKVACVFYFLIALLVAARLFAADLSALNGWICLAIVGFTPAYWEVKDGIASEHLFLPLWYAALLVADDWYRRQRVFGSQTLHGILLGGLIFLACATRSVGVVLLPAVFVCEVLIARRATRVGVIALSSAVALLLAQRLVLPASGAGYLEQLRGTTLSSLLANAWADTTSFSLIWQNGHWSGVRRIAGAAFALLGAFGFLRANLPRPTPLGVAAAGYFAVIVIWPSADGLRMILPLLPAFVFYLLLGIQSLTSVAIVAFRSAKERRFAERKPTTQFAFAGSLGLLVFSLASFGAAYSVADFGPIPTGVETPAARDLFDFVRNHTRSDDVCLFFKPRALALYTGRRSSAYPLGTDELEFWRYAKSIGATIIIVRTDAADLAGEDQTSEMLAPFPSRDLEEVFANSQFRVYRWTPPATDVRKMAVQAVEFAAN
ncbi:MAG: hypothetical protein HY290_14610 [Planctomycetia bacterium]|nr:hypothetical protein [Planctomycetia bacterium]